MVVLYVTDLTSTVSSGNGSRDVGFSNWLTKDIVEDVVEAVTLPEAKNITGIAIMLIVVVKNVLRSI